MLGSTRSWRDARDGSCRGCRMRGIGRHRRKASIGDRLTRVMRDARWALLTGGASPAQTGRQQSAWRPRGGAGPRRGARHASVPRSRGVPRRRERRATATSMPRRCLRPKQTLGDGARRGEVTGSPGERIERRSARRWIREDPARRGTTARGARGRHAHVRCMARAPPRPARPLRCPVAVPLRVQGTEASIR